MAETNSTDTSKPTPLPNPETQAFWDACLREELTVQLCGQCANKQHYPRALCHACGSKELSQVAVTGKGTIASFTVNRVPVSSHYAQDVPYAVALVNLDEGVTMMANVTHCDPETLQIGQRVHAHFETRGEIKLPQFRPLKDG